VTSHDDFHPIGTLRMGRARTDPMAVVGFRLRLRGVGPPAGGSDASGDADHHLGQTPLRR